MDVDLMVQRDLKKVKIEIVAKTYKKLFNPPSSGLDR
jgi:hypothetical protein